MHLKLFISAVLLVFLLTLCQADGSLTKNKATGENTAQTANINTKRGDMPPPSSGSVSKNAGGIMQQLLKGYLGTHINKTPTFPVNASATDDSDSTTTDDSGSTTTDDNQTTKEDPNLITINEGFAAVNASMDALFAAVERDDSIVGEISKNITLSIDLLEQVEKLFDPKNIQPSLDKFSQLVDTLEAMAVAIVEQNDDARLGKLLKAVALSLHQLVLAFKPFDSSTGSSPATLPDLSGVDSAIAGQQEA